MNLKLLSLILLFATLLAGMDIKAAEKSSEGSRSIIVEADGYVYLSEDKTMRQLRNEARMEAKRLALEQGEMSIKSLTVIKNNMQDYDVIQTSAEGVIKILEFKDHGIQPDNRWRYWIKAEIRYILKEKVAAENIEPVIPSPVRQDNFAAGPLTVKIWPGKKQYKVGEQMEFFIQGNHDFYARIIYIDSQGNKIQLVPNRHESDNFFRGGRKIKIPRTTDKYKLTVSSPLGSERVIVYASTAQQGDVPLKPMDNSLYKVEADLKQIQYQTRGVRIEGKKSAEFYETECRIMTAE